MRMTVQSLLDNGACAVRVLCPAEGMAGLSGLIEDDRVSFTAPCADGKDSFCAVGPADGVMYLPWFLPAVLPTTVETLVSKAGSGEREVLRPAYFGREGYPVFMTGSAAERFLGGDKSCIDALGAHTIETDDAGTRSCTDAAELRALAKRRRGISVDICRKLMEDAKLPVHIQKHCLATGVMAGHMAETLTRCGLRLDVELCRSAGSIHDICKLSGIRHAHVGGAYLKELGYDAVADVVYCHNDFEFTDAPDLDEKCLVCLADKLTKEDQTVTVRERYDRIRHIFPPDSDMGRRIIADETTCQMLYDRYVSITGDDVSGQNS
ncbi:MAG: HD domain-containing protein [Oscillospiraceae bacterium]|nr:HD domain-containing protein [Oscillospiraceae bacterium]